MIKARVSPNLLSFVTIRRGNWVMKISVFKSQYVLVMGQNYYETDQFFIKQFTHHVEAADFIDMIAQKDDFDDY
jgi:hypothetical protein